MVKAYEDAEWDEDLHRLLFGPDRCFQCGSEFFKEILDSHGGVIYCCSDCPEYEQLN